MVPAIPFALNKVTERIGKLAKPAGSAQFQLRAHLFLAKGLTPLDPSGLSDAYVVVSLGGRQWRSSTKEQSLNINPQWFSNGLSSSMLTLIDHCSK